MIHGLDTGFLVAAEVIEHAEHADARATLARLLGAGDQIGIAAQVLAEFIHIVTDPRRFTHPLDIAAAYQLAEQWWTASDVVHVFPDDAATRQFLIWLGQFSLGRKAPVGHAARRDLPPSRYPIAAHDQRGRLRSVRRDVHHTEGDSFESLTPLPGRKADELALIERSAG